MAIIWCSLNMAIIRMGDRVFTAISVGHMGVDYKMTFRASGIVVHVALTNATNVSKRVNKNMKSQAMLKKRRLKRKKKMPRKNLKRLSSNRTT